MLFSRPLLRKTTTMKDKNQNRDCKTESNNRAILLIWFLPDLLCNCHNEVQAAQKKKIHTQMSINSQFFIYELLSLCKRMATSGILCRKALFARSVLLSSVSICFGPRAQWFLYFYFKRGGTNSEKRVVSPAVSNSFCSSSSVEYSLTSNIWNLHCKKGSSWICWDLSECNYQFRYFPTHS